MSLDVYLISGKTEITKCPHCDQDWEVPVDPDFDLNMTHNNNKMADVADLYKVFWHPDEIGVVYAKDAIPYLE